jgi:hypothetical protein
LSDTTVLAPRLGNSPLFHTPLPDPDPDLLAPRLGVPPRDIEFIELLDLDGGLVAFLTSEAAQGRILNSDRDKLDVVLQSFDAVTGIVRNSRQAAVPGSLVDLGDGLVAFLTPESAQRKVLNRDGDKLDLVLQVFDAETGEVRSSRQAVVRNSVVSLGDGLVAFLTPEASQRRDLNGDQDKLDDVLVAFDFFDNVTRNSGQQAIASTLLDLGNGLVAFATVESSQGLDLNEDGDKQDAVLQSFDANTGLVQNSGQAVNF